MELQTLIRREHILEYADLLDILQDNEMLNALDVARNHTMFLNTYITSRRYKTRNEQVSEKK